MKYFCPYCAKELTRNPMNETVIQCNPCMTSFPIPKLQGLQVGEFIVKGDNISAEEILCEIFPKLGKPRARSFVEGLNSSFMNAVGRVLAMKEKTDG